MLLSRPYSPQTTGQRALVGRDRELELMTAAWLSRDDSPPMSPLLLGKPGVGKNRLVYEVARQMNTDLYIFQGHEDVTAEDLACGVRFTDGGAGALDYVASPLVTAMLEGAICFVDEIGKIRPRALALLASVLDDRRYIDSLLLGDRVEAKPGFRFVAASNTSDLESIMLPDFVRSRLRPVIHVEPPSEDEISEVIRNQFAGLKRSLPHLVNGFWQSWRKLRGDEAPTPRDALSVFALASRLADRTPHADLAEAGLCRDHIETAVQHLFTPGSSEHP